MRKTRTDLRNDADDVRHVRASFLEDVEELVERRVVVHLVDLVVEEFHHCLHRKPVLWVQKRQILPKKWHTR